MVTVEQLSEEIAIMKKHSDEWHKIYERREKERGERIILLIEIVRKFIQLDSYKEKFGDWSEQYKLQREEILKEAMNEVGK